VKQAHLGDMLKKASNSVCSSTTGVSPNPLSPTPSTYEDPENTDRNLMTLNQHMKEISKWNTPLINCTAQVYKSSNKKLPIRTSVSISSV
jgi:hypothetical protein